ncbi:MAG: DUF3991 domain-containing protein [Schaedlerella sp.]|uniref:DUF3991 domain-containing protein n=1 Tax=Schaedlerella sp. TaxID=2676057 RepID=UPI00265DFB0F|nr:DUF3991 domain-containing protein [uncultured Schaedlerella sp.]
MPWFGEEQLEAVRSVTAMEYLQKHQPGRLKRSSARNEWELTDHDSFKINGTTSKWHWKSRDIGGISALNFLIRVDGMEFREAVEMLLQENPSLACLSPQPEERPKKPFVLPEPFRNCSRVQRYLNSRGISSEVIHYCRRLGILYESSPYHNAVFVGVDEEQKPRYAFMRGIYDKGERSFRIEQAGSEKRYAFCVPPKTGSIRVAVYEACIDALAHMTLEEGRADKYRLALGGISAPRDAQSAGKERQEISGNQMPGRTAKNPPALVQFLKNHPEIEEIEICMDNDFAGRWACGQIKAAYGTRYRILENLPQTEGADYGDLAVREMERKRSLSRQNVR